jgi:hypothetical protein
MRASKRGFSASGMRFPPLCGAISVILKRPTPAEERQSEVTARLDELLREVREPRRAGGAAG